MSTSLEQTVFSTVLNGLRLIITLFLAGGFLGIGMLKLISFPDIQQMFASWGVDNWLMYLIGGVEVIISILLIYPPLRKWALIGILALMTGALLTHLHFKDYSFLFGPVCIMVATLYLLVLEFNILKIEKHSPNY